MCILVAKRAGVRKPTEQEIRTMAQNNPDGCGIVFARGGKLHWKHSMNVNKIVKFAKQIREEDPAIFHFRIATHGSVNVNNCHPFMDADKTIAFAHNGILSVLNDGDKTDSQTAFDNIYFPLIATFGMDERLDAAVRCTIGTSKFAFLTTYGELKTYGQFIEQDGLMFSNSSYKPKVITNYFDPTPKYDYYYSKYYKEDDYYDPQLYYDAQDILYDYFDRALALDDDSFSAANIKKILKDGGFDVSVLTMYDIANLQADLEWSYSYKQDIDFYNKGSY